MIKRFALALMTVLLLPVLACAGIVSSAVLTGSGSGTITPSGSKNYTATNPTYVITAVSGFTLDKVTLRTGSGPVNTVTPSGTGPWSYVAPLSGSVQTLSVYFKQDVPAVRLNANLGLTPKTAVANTQLTISGGASTIYPVGTSVGYTYAVSTGGVLTTTSGTASNTSAMTTKFSAVEPGLYTVTLTMTKGAITSSNTATINVTGEGLAASNLCLSCHTGWPQAVAYAGSIHSHNAYASCEACHNPDGNQAHSFQTHDSTVDPSKFTVISSAAIGRVNGMRNGTVFCTQCHNGAIAIPHAVPVPNKNCNVCHTPSGTADAHSIVPFATMTVAGCVDCHSVAQSVPDLVADNNNGVRSITQEFGKWSHHVTGVELDNAHCAACHLEGKISGGKVVIDFDVHMKDATTHLRNADTDADMVWNPASPNHSTMDNYCMTCHDGNGATSPMSVLIQKYINDNGVAAAGKTASAKNPFGDTISNRYDKMQRPAVINVSSQFDTTNNSHHGVKGPRYSGNSRFTGTNPVDGNVRRPITSAATFANNSSQLLQGVRRTIYDAGNFNQLYSPLANATGEVAPRTGAKNLGDDSTLHCGDCHTVGQWKVASSETKDGVPTPVAIGAHGSNNEYLLRNTLGTDERHTQNAYLSGAIITGTAGTTGIAALVGNGVLKWPTGTTSPTIAAYNTANGTNLVAGTSLIPTGVSVYSVCWPSGVTYPTLAAYNAANGTSLVVGSPIPVGVTVYTVLWPAYSDPSVAAYNAANGTNYAVGQNVPNGLVLLTVAMPAGAIAPIPNTDPQTYANIPVGSGIPLGTTVYTNPTGAFLVCYNCHAYKKYGSIYAGTGLNGANAQSGPHVGEYDAQGRCNGIGNTLPFNGFTTGTKTDGTQFASRFMGPITKYSTAASYLGEQQPDFGNVFGIQCNNCHNSGIGNAYGGIHGSANNTDWSNGTSVIAPNAAVTGGAYIDGMGNTVKVERFLPGLGNVMHVPGTLGGFIGGSTVPVNTTIGPAYTYITGGISNDTNWEQKHWQQTATTVLNATTGVATNVASAGAGCYTLGATVVTGAAIIKSDVSSGLEGPSVTGENGPATEAADTWGGCDDHTAGQAMGNHGFIKRIIRPVTY